MIGYVEWKAGENESTGENEDVAFRGDDEDGVDDQKLHSSNKHLCIEAMAISLTNFGWGLWDVS